jgi:hypothetical protein
VPVARSHRQRVFGERDAAVLRPVIAIQTPIVNGFGEMFGGDGGGMIEVGDGTGDLQDAVVGAETAASITTAKRQNTSPSRTGSSQFVPPAPGYPATARTTSTAIDLRQPNKLLRAASFARTQAVQSSAEHQR